MILRDDVKLIVDIPNPTGPERMGEVKDYRVYDLKTDPGESDDISGHQQMLQELEQTIKDSAISGSKETKIAEDTKKQLRALGYFGQ